MATIGESRGQVGRTLGRVVWLFKERSVYLSGLFLKVRQNDLVTIEQHTSAGGTTIFTKLQKNPYYKVY